VNGTVGTGVDAFRNVLILSVYSCNVDLCCTLRRNSGDLNMFCRSSAVIAVSITLKTNFAFASVYSCAQ
jgi:hypothetical protein